MPKVFNHRAILLMMIFMLVMTGTPITLPGQAAAEPNVLLFQEDFENGAAAAWTPVQGNWETVNGGNPTLFSDDFENESAAQWSNNGGAWVASYNGSSYAYKQTNENGASELVAGDAAWTDYVYEADVKLGGGAGAMMDFRYMDSRHFYYLYMSDTYIRIMKQNGDVQDWIKAYDGPSLDRSDYVRIKVEASGNQFKIYRNGELVLTATDDNAPFLSGKIGLATWATSVEFDNVSVTNLAMNQVFFQSDSQGGEAYAGDEAWSDYAVQVQVAAVDVKEDGKIGIGMRYQDANNKYVVQYSASGTVQIAKVENGQTTVLAEAPYSLTPGMTYAFKGVAAGKQLELHINGVKLLSAVDTAFAAGKISLSLTRATGTYDSVSVFSVSVPVVSDGNTTYYVSSDTGNDANDGLSEATAWRTLDKVNQAVFRAGDSILLKAGDAWNEPLLLSGSGTAQSPIKVASYGTGAKPVISWNAPGGGSVITGYNLSHWIIQGLAVNIIASSTLSWNAVTAGILIQYDSSKPHGNVVIDGNEVYSASYDGNTNGIVVSALVPGTDNREVATDIVISNNTVHNIGWYGITTTGWDTAKNEELRSQLLYGNLKVSGNLVHHTASQGIVVQNAHNSVIERNVVHDGGQGIDTWGPGGIWFIASRDSVIQFNEVYNMKDAGSGYDGAGINIDWFCDNITMRYNYSHDNKGNGITTMSNYGGKIINNKVRGNQALQSNGRGQIALGNFTGRPDLSTGLHDVEVANNTIIVDVDNTVAVNSAANPYGTWTGISIHDNRIVLKEGTIGTGVFDIGPDTSVETIDRNSIFSDSLRFNASFHDTPYTDLASWQAGTGYDRATRLLPSDLTPPSAVLGVVAALDGYVRLSWTPAADANDEIAHYNIYRSTTADFVPAYANMVGESVSASFEDREEMLPNTTYFYKIEAEDRSGNVGIASAAISVTTGPSVPVAEKPKTVDFLSIRDGYELTLADLSTAPYITGIPNVRKVQLFVDDRLEQELDTAPYAYTITGLSNGEHRLQYKVYDQSGAVTESRPITVYKHVSALRSLYATQRPTVDGNLDEWSAPGFRMNERSQLRSIEPGFADRWSLKQLEAVGYTSWDENHFYFAMEVTEDNHHLAIADPADLWKGSGIQIAIDPDRGSSPGSKGYTELAFGLTDDGQALGYRYHAIAGKAEGVFTAGEIAIVRDSASNKTRYEISVPWSELIPAGLRATDGSALGISVLANYSDGTVSHPDHGDSRNGWIEYNSGIGAGKAPAQFGYMLLGNQPFAAPLLSGTISGQKAALSWEAIVGASGYIVKYGTSPGIYENAINVGPSTSYETPNLTRGKTYYFAANVYDSYGESGLSNEIALFFATGAGSQPNAGGSGGSPGVNNPSESIEIKQGTAYVTIDESSPQARLPLAALGDYPLQVRLGGVALDIPKAVLKKLKEQAGEAQSASIEIGIVPLKETSAPENGGSVRWTLADRAYDISVSLITNGQRLPFPSGDIAIALPYDPDQVDEQLLGLYLYEEGTWKYIGGSADPVKKLVSALLPRSGVYSLFEYDRSFADVPAEHWANRTLQILAAKHIVNGRSDSLFDPAGKTTRAEFVALLVSALRLPSASEASGFNDVAPGAWYADAIAAAVRSGIATGRSSDRFAPEQPMTRAEMVVMLARALRIEAGSGTAADYADASDIPAWAQAAVIAASKAGLVRGDGNRLFAPQRQATRAEAAQLIYNLLRHKQG